MREGTLFPGERVYMFFQLRSIFPLGRFTVWSLWGKELYSLVRGCTCSYSWEVFFPLEGLQCEVYEVRSSVPWWDSVQCTVQCNISCLCIFKLRIIFLSERFTVWSLWVKELCSPVRECTVHVLSVEKHFPLWKVYIVESMREGSPFAGERVYNIHVLSIENHFSPLEGLQCEVCEGRISIRRWESIQNYTCSFSKEAFFALEGLQCGVYTLKIF